MTFDAVRGAVYKNGIFASLRQAFVLERRTGCVGLGVGMYTSHYLSALSQREVASRANCVKYLQRRPQGFFSIPVSLAARQVPVTLLQPLLCCPVA